MADTDPFNLIPTPQHIETLPGSISVSGLQPVSIVTSPQPKPQTVVAAEYLKQEIETHPREPANSVRITDTPDPDGTAIRLVEQPHDEETGAWLNELDEEILSERHYGQSYVLRTLHADDLKPEKSEEHLNCARKYTEEAGNLAQTFFPEVSDPAGAEVGSLQIQIRELQEAINRML